MAKAKSKSTELLFIGGSRDGCWFDVPDHLPSMQLAPKQWVDEFVFPVEVKKGEEAGPTFVTETYTRRGISFPDGDMEWFALEDLDDATCLDMMMQRYDAEPVIHGEPPHEQAAAEAEELFEPVDKA